MAELITQQFKLYEAEELGIRGRRFIDEDDLRIWLFDSVIDQPWFDRWSHVTGIHVKCNRGRREGSVGGLHDGIAVMEFAPQHMCEQFVLHELAHCCAAPESQAHDPLFARTYLGLVYLAQGVEAWTRLRGAFVDHGVCFDERCQELPVCRCS